MLPAIHSKYSFWGIHNKLIATFLAITVVPLVTLSYLIELDVTRQNEQAVIETTTRELVQIDKTITMFLDDMKDNVRDLVNQPLLKNVDDSVTSYLAAKDGSTGVVKMAPAATGSLEAEIYEKFLSFMTFHPKIEFMSMGVESNGGYIQCPATTRRVGYDPRARDWYKLAAATPGEVVVTDPYYASNDEAVEVSFVKAVLDDAGNLKGVVSLDVTLQGLSELIKDYRIGQNGYIILTDKNGTVLADPVHPDMIGKNIEERYPAMLDEPAGDSSKVFEDKLDGRPTVFYVYTSPRSAWKIIGVADKADIVAGASRLQGRILLFTFPIMLLAVATGIFIARRITDPIRQVVAAAEGIAAGDLAAPQKYKLRGYGQAGAKDEIGVLEHSIVFMAAEIERSFRELAESMQAMNEKERKIFQAEIKALQAQIRPHFFFNALNTVACHCRLDPEKAQQLLAHMGTYLRGCFNLGEDFIPLEKELEFVRAYLFLEQARMGDRLKVVLDTEGCQECVVPALIIQPLVENAVRHGVFPKIEGGTVTLSCRRGDGGFIIQVKDDGVGMPPEKLTALARGVQAQSSGIGIRNVEARLKNLFGSGLEIISREDEGTSITFTIPEPDHIRQLAHFAG